MMSVVVMVKEAVGSFRFAKRSRTGIIYVPSILALDSAFPFKEGRVRIRIDGERLIIEEVARVCLNVSPVH